jgi:hypothetical protein
VAEDNQKSNKHDVSAEYRKWWRKLTPEERRKLIASGCFEVKELHNADAALRRTIADDTPINFLSADATNHRPDWLVKITSTDKNPVIDAVIDGEELGMDSKSLEAQSLALIRLRAMLHFLLETLDGSTDQSVRLHAQIIRIVVGEGSPARMTELAKEFGLTKSAISLRCRTMLRRLGLEPSKYMRSLHDVEKIKIAAMRRSIQKVNTKIVKKNKCMKKLNTLPVRNLLNMGVSERKWCDQQYVTERLQKPLRIAN